MLVLEYIKHSQRRIYKKRKGSSGRKKARKLYAKKHLKGRGGHPRINATGVEISTLVGENLLEQILTMNVESPCL